MKEENRWYEWSCAHTGKKFKTKFFTEEEQKKEFERVWKLFSDCFSSFKFLEYKYKHSK